MGLFDRYGWAVASFLGILLVAWWIVKYTFIVVWFIVKWTTIILLKIAYFLFWIMLGWMIGASIVAREERLSGEGFVMGVLPEDSTTAAEYRVIQENAKNVYRSWQ